MKAIWGGPNLVVGLQVVNLFVEGVEPELLADEHHRVQLVLGARRVAWRSLHETLAHAATQQLQPLQHVSLQDTAQGTWLRQCSIVATNVTNRSSLLLSLRPQNKCACCRWSTLTFLFRPASRCVCDTISMCRNSKRHWLASAWTVVTDISKSSKFKSYRVQF